MNQIAGYIRDRLSLRPPQTESLEILAKLTDILELKKQKSDVYLQKELEKVKKIYPTSHDFERNFPSFCFALATGVGKTRLMGAFIVYLFKSKGIKNFFVLAPNLTIYNKLIDDFSNSSSPKYVFQGIGEFVHTKPRIINGENYNYASQLDVFKSEVHINIFNISKINAETRKDNVPRIKRLSEYIGDSYFNYLSNLDDLVLLMDESHHYRADRGMEVINELNPILGLELTATPQTEQSGKTIKFKNVVYEYSLAKAIKDGFIKEPAVATRKDFDPSKYSPEDLDRIKLEDGIRIHEDTKVALDIYSKDNKKNPVKPFVLVVAKDTEHASKLKNLITSSSFFNGYYADKVMEIHSNQRGAEKDENVELLISLEKTENKIEIVIHVNMLKEGWDVTNLYTIIPLRTSASKTLTEQTIGRGLRLPYGKRTGNDKVDKLTIVAHDKFQEIIDEANKPDSIIKKENIIIIDEDELSHPKEVIQSYSTAEVHLIQEKDRIEKITQPEEKQKAEIANEAKMIMIKILPEISKEVKNIHELKTESIKQIAINKAKKNLYDVQQQDLLADLTLKEVENSYAANVEEFIKNIIEIPRIYIEPGESESGFYDFDLDTKNLNYQPVSEEILIKKLREQDNDVETIIGKGRFIPDKLDNIIVNELINYPEIDYDINSNLLFKMAKQVIAKFEIYLNKEELDNVVQYHKKEIGKFIYSQLMEHFYYKTPNLIVKSVYPFSKIEEHNFSKNTDDKIYHYKETITPTSLIKSKVFNGFKKSCHVMYKFKSKTEKDFAILIEKDDEVVKWLIPAQNQFHIYWKNNSRRYIPDFVSETENTIYLIEVKAEGNFLAADVQEKAKAAVEYCKHATEYTKNNGGKPWKYILIPHDVVMLNMSFNNLVKVYEYKNE